MAREQPCPHFPNCVGCALIGQPYGVQLARKRDHVRRVFAANPALAELPVPEVIGSPKAFGYRNQAKLVARRAAGGLLLGIYRPGSHQVVDIRRCPVHHPLIESILSQTASVIERLDLPIYDERTHTGLLRYVVVRVSTWTKRAQLILVTRERTLPNTPALKRSLRRIRGLVSVVQNINPAPGNVIFGPQFVPLEGDLDLIERVGDFKLKSRAGAFLQANIPVARKLYQRVFEWAALDSADTVADLFCGVGAISFHLAMAAGHVAGIDASPLAVLDAKTNIRLNGFHNVRFYTGDSAEVLPVLSQRLGRIDVITLNPPRKGADEPTRSAIAACTPRRIVYVSCEPTTLARDLTWFTEHGYRTTEIQPYDMLPQTEHVECVASLDRL